MFHLAGCTEFLFFWKDVLSLTSTYITLDMFCHLLLGVLFGFRDNFQYISASFYLSKYFRLWTRKLCVVTVSFIVRSLSVLISKRIYLSIVVCKAFPFSFICTWIIIFTRSRCLDFEMRILSKSGVEIRFQWSNSYWRIGRIVLSHQPFFYVREKVDEL